MSRLTIAVTLRSLFHSTVGRAMGSRLPVISGRDAARIFQKAGFALLPGRGKGSHIVLTRPSPPTLLTIPDHRELKRGTLRSLIREAGMSVEQFTALM